MQLCSRNFGCVTQARSPTRQSQIRRRLISAVPQSSPSVSEFRALPTLKGEAHNAQRKHRCAEHWAAQFLSELRAVDRCEQLSKAYLLVLGARMGARVAQTRVFLCFPNAFPKLTNFGCQFCHTNWPQFSFWWPIPRLPRALSNAYRPNSHAVMGFLRLRAPLDIHHRWSSSVRSDCAFEQLTQSLLDRSAPSKR